MYPGPEPKQQVQTGYIDINIEINAATKLSIDAPEQDPGITPKVSPPPWPSLARKHLKVSNSSCKARAADM
eukprot:3932009-Rhodomonas_salina.1